MKNKNDQNQDTSFDMGRGGGGRISLRNLKTFSSLKNPVFRLYFGGMVGWTAAMNMQMITRSLLLYRLTGSAALLGFMALATAIPMILLSLFGGVIADRVQKKLVIIVGLFGFAAVSLTVALTLTTGYLSVDHPGSWWILMANSVLQGILMGLTMPSRQAIILEIVGDRQVMNAIALSSLEMNTLRFLAPALAGFLIDAFDFQAVFYTMTALYLLGAALIALMPLTGTMTLRGSGALADIAEGLKYIRQEPAVLMVLVFTLFAVLLSMPYQMMLPIFADDILKVGAKGLGLLMSLSGAGAMVAAFTIASLPNRRRGVMLLVSGLIMGLALIAFSFSTTWSLSLIMMAVVGLGQTGRMALGNTMLQNYAKDEYRGRVMSFLMMDQGLSSLGTFAAGLLAEGIGVEWAIGGFATLLVFFCILTLIFVPRLRKLQ
ncbi:MAG: transporter [Dehalococcoidales bacterium]|nr:transporter [Dehalococcoidales bacterium]